MRIFTTIHMGQHHSIHCEDDFFEGPLGGGYHLIAVMDGCSSGVEAHFASALLKKILKNTAKEHLRNSTPADAQTLLKGILKTVFKELQEAKARLGLETIEMLSTLLLGAINPSKKSGEFIAIGDGLIFYNGKAREYAQNNRPDYLAYHLSEDFESWYKNQSQRLSLQNLSDVCLATDGIFSFMNKQNLMVSDRRNELLDFLLKDAEGSAHQNFLKTKVETLERVQNLVPYDDLAIVRIFLD